MIERYTIGYDHEEETLFLYLSYDYEFGSFDARNAKDLMQEIKQYIKDRKIKFHGKKVALVVGGIVIAVLTLPLEKPSPFPLLSVPKEIWNIDVNSYVLDDNIGNSPIEIESPIIETVNQNIDVNNQEVSVIQNSKKQVTINRSDTMVTMDLEDYVLGVVAAEMPASFSIEALKAQSVLARTYALKAIEDNRRLTDDITTQVYQDESQLRALWGADFTKYYSKIKNACQSTEGQVLRYDGAYIDAVYHSTSNGQTEAARNVWGYEVPYLQSVDSSWDKSASTYLKQIIKELSTIWDLLGIKTEQFEILSRTESGRVAMIQVGDQQFQGIDFRNLLGLRSADFDLKIENGYLIVTTKGYGHGVGMSQYGANGMAQEGYSYQAILHHYYINTTLESM